MQTLGTPVSLMTIPGVVAACLAMGFLPLLGRLADGGSQPHRRRKPAVVGAFCLAVFGMGLMFGGAALHVWETAPPRPQQHQSATARPIGPATSPSPRPQQHKSATGLPIGPATSPSPRPLHDLPRATTGFVETVSSVDTEDSGLLTEARPGLEDPANERTLSVSLNSSQADVVTTVLRSAAVRPQDSSRESGPGEPVPSAPSAHPATPCSARINARGEQRETTPLIHVTSGQSEGTATAGSSTPDSTDPTGVPTRSQALGLPVAALLAMAGIVVTDMATDLTNSAVKTCMLTHSLPADHASLLVTGVFMSALGGCVTSVSGLVQFSSLLPGV